MSELRIHLQMQYVKIFKGVRRIYKESQYHLGEFKREDENNQIQMIVQRLLYETDVTVYDLAVLIGIDSINFYLWLHNPGAFLLEGRYVTVFFVELLLKIVAEDLSAEIKKTNYPDDDEDEPSASTNMIWETTPPNDNGTNI